MNKNFNYAAIAAIATGVVVGAIQYFTNEPAGKAELFNEFCGIETNHRGIETKVCADSIGRTIITDQQCCAGNRYACYVLRK